MAGRAAHQKPLEAHLSPGKCPMCTPRGGGRSTRGEGAARVQEDPRWARGAGARAFTAPLHAPFAVRQMAAWRVPKPNTPMPDCERDVHAGRVRGVGAVRGSRPCTRGAHVKAGALTCHQVCWLILLPSPPNLRHLRPRPRRGVARGAAARPGPRGAARRAAPAARAERAPGGEGHGPRARTGRASRPPPTGLRGPARGGQG